MNQKIKKFFSKTIDSYDTVCDLVVQENQALHDQVLSSLTFEVGQALKILDLGCGCGNLMYDMLRKYNNAWVKGIDFSPIMIDSAAEKLSAYSGRFELVLGDILNGPLGDGYDAIISTVTIHNLAHPEKFDLFKKIARALKPEGVFVNGDFIQGETDFLDSILKKIYLNFVYKNLSGEELKVWVHHITNDDQPMKLSEQFKMLESFNMRTPEVSWTYANQAVYTSSKL